MNSLCEDIHHSRGQLDENHNLDVPDLESQLLKEVISFSILYKSNYFYQDPDCVFAERPLTQYDLYVSTLVPVKGFDRFEPRKMDPKKKMLKEPWCSTKEILHINIHSIDRIASIIDRKNLIMQGGGKVIKY